MKVVQTDVSNVCLDPNEARYWDPASLEKEAQRAFEICEGCRLCFKYCSTFPSIFKSIENTANNNVVEVDFKNFDPAVAECFQCKLCLVQCPYTVKENHAFALDLPALLRRYAAVRKIRPRFGLKALRNFMLARPVWIGKLGGVFPGIFNWINRLAVNRFLLHITLGIHRSKKLPAVARERFSKWLSRHRQVVTSGAQSSQSDSSARTAEPKRVALFPTCYGEYNDPRIPQAAVSVLNKNGRQVECLSGECCGAPQLDLPNFETARRWAKKIIDQHQSAIDAGTPIVVLNPTCSLTMRHDYITLFPEGPERERAKKFAALVRDSGEFLWELKQADEFNRDFKSSPGGTAYHAPCHLKAQSIGFRSRDLLRLIPQNPIEFNDECSCHDGTFAYKRETFDISRRYGQNAFEKARAAQSKIKVTDCPLAAMQLEEGAGLDSRPLHSLEVMAKAYSADGFEIQLPLE